MEYVKSIVCSFDSSYISHTLKVAMLAVYVNLCYGIVWYTIVKGAMLYLYVIAIYKTIVKLNIYIS